MVYLYVHTTGPIETKPGMGIVFDLGIVRNVVAKSYARREHLACLVYIKSKLDRHFFRCDS